VNLIIFLLVAVFFFCGGGFYLGGPCGGVLGLLLLTWLAGNFAVQFHPQS